MAKILVVDDDFFVCQMVKKAFLAAGHNVVISTNGKAAFDCMRTGKFDILITDLLMPGMNGRDLLNSAVNHPEIPKIPVIVITAARNLELRVELLRNGAADILEKPFQIEELVIRTHRVLDRLSVSDGMQGFLDVYSVADLAQNFAITQKSGWLEIGTKGEMGYLVFSEGQIVKARFGDLVQREAFWEMNDLKAGWFRFSSSRDVKMFEKDPPLNLNSLLMSAAWLEDELDRTDLDSVQPDGLLKQVKDADEVLPADELPLFNTVLGFFHFNAHHTKADLLNANLASKRRAQFALNWLVHHGYLAHVKQES